MPRCPLLTVFSGMAPITMVKMAPIHTTYTRHSKHIASFPWSPYHASKTKCYKHSKLHCEIKNRAFTRPFYRRSPKYAKLPPTGICDKCMHSLCATSHCHNGHRTHSYDGHVMLDEKSRRSRRKHTANARYTPETCSPNPITTRTIHTRRLRLDRRLWLRFSIQCHR